MKAAPCQLLEGLLAKPPAARLHFVRNVARYQDPQLCRALLDQARQLRFTSASEMLDLAHLAVEIAFRCSLPTRDLADLLAEAWLGLANALTVKGDLTAANSAFEVATRFEPLGSGSRLTECKRCEWLATLRTRQGRLTEGILLLARAIELRLDTERHPRASILIQASIICLEAGQPLDGLLLVTEAMEMVDLRQDLKLGLIARHHGARCLCELGRLQDALATIDRLTTLYEVAGDPIMQVRQLWLRGRILASFGSQRRDREAEEAFKEAVAESVRLQLPYETACLLLELGIWYADRGRDGLLEGVIDDLVPTLKILGLDRQPYANRLLAVAVDRRLARQVFTELREALDRRPPG